MYVTLKHDKKYQQKNCQAGLLQKKFIENPGLNLIFY